MIFQKGDLVSWSTPNNTLLGIVVEVGTLTDIEAIRCRAGFRTSYPVDVYFFDWRQRTCWNHDLQLIQRKADK